MSRQLCLERQSAGETFLACDCRRFCDLKFAVKFRVAASGTAAAHRWILRSAGYVYDPGSFAPFEPSKTITDYYQSVRFDPR